MQVTIIGSGNIATVMGRVLYANGHTIHQVYSPRPAHAAALATELHALAVSDLRQIDGEADLYLFAVTDDALPALAAGLSLPGKLLVHTAGSVSKEVLSCASDRYGVVWPIKMVRRSMQTLAPVTIAIDGNTEAVVREIQSFAGIFSGDLVTADDQQRLKMHLLASFTLNFTNHLFHLAAGYCEKEGLDFSVFHPLIIASVERIATEHPRALQAGPAFRGDRQTMEKHLSLLENHPQAREIYKLMSESIAASFSTT